MQPERLSDDELSAYLAACPGEAAALVLEMRHVVLTTAPQVTEAIRFGTLCYFKSDHEYGAIGGNVCMIDGRGGGVTLAFLHGAALPDPAGLLRGRAKAKRSVPIRTEHDARRPEISELIRAAAGYEP
ncbi:MAG: DUF1801 domain-containing protein [Phycisphaerae bacterium]